MKLTRFEEVMLPGKNGEAVALAMRILIYMVTQKG
jgi:predicted aconitase